MGNINSRLSLCGSVLSRICSRYHTRSYRDYCEFGTATSDDRTRHYIVVKLDHGNTVSAGVYRGAPTRIGRRVTLTESTMSVGWKRYHFRKILAAQANSLE